MVIGVQQRSAVMATISPAVEQAVVGNAQALGRDEVAVLPVLQHVAGHHRRRSAAAGRATLAALQMMLVSVSIYIWNCEPSGRSCLVSSCVCTRCSRSTTRRPGKANQIQWSTKTQEPS